jgi:D-methionine transport system ATP-binding protein
MIELSNINKTYSSHAKPFHALKNINLSIHRGDIFGILGESGAGKSTLLRIINLLERPTSGEVIVDKVNLTLLSANELRQARHNIGMIFQHFNLLESRTAFGNIALPLELIGTSKEMIREEVTRLLSLVGLSHHANHYPKQLSGGQKQRVAIARALATKPHLLLCDEATSALDTKSTYAILNLLKEINRKLNVTIVLITHELDVIKQICDRAAVLHHGELIETGTVLELFAKPRSDITRELLHKSLHIDLPPTILRVLKQDPQGTTSRIVRFTFVGEESAQPLMSSLAKNFDITINILQANIETVQDATIGFTVCQITGEKSVIDAALASIHPSTITTEVLGHV